MNSKKSVITKQNAPTLLVNRNYQTNKSAKKLLETKTQPLLGKKKKAAFTFVTAADVKKKKELQSKLAEKVKNEETVKNIANKEILKAKEEPVLVAPTPVPVVEWWDKPFLLDPTLPVSESNLNRKLITRLVHHPAKEQELKIKEKPIITPILLTKEEKKKLRRKQKREEQVEQRELVQLGEAEPNPAKLTYSNYTKILGDMAVKNPTKAKQLVDKAYEERRIKMETENEERKLTKEQKAAKLRKKFEKDASENLEALLCLLPSTVTKQQKFKLMKNAEQLYLTGILSLNSSGSLRSFVLAEGGHKALQKYKHLIENRIEWGEEAAQLAWTGPLQSRKFKHLKVSSSSTLVQVKSSLTQADYAGLVPLVNK